MNCGQSQFADSRRGLAAAQIAVLEDKVGTAGPRPIPKGSWVFGGSSNYLKTAEPFKPHLNPLLGLLKAIEEGNQNAALQVLNAFGERPRRWRYWRRIEPSR